MMAVGIRSACTHFAFPGHPLVSPVGHNCPEQGLLFVMSLELKWEPKASPSPDWCNVLGGLCTIAALLQPSSTSRAEQKGCTVP